MLDTIPSKIVMSSYHSFWASLRQELEDDYNIFQNTTDFEMQFSNYQVFQENNFKLSFFSSKKDNQPNPKKQSWNEFISNFDKPHVRASKDGELFSPATFNGKRANENVQELSMIAFDYDHNADWENDLSVFRNLNITFVAYTTHSHLRVVPPTKESKGNPNTEPRFRVIVPLLTSIPRNKYKSLWKFFNNLIDGKIDGAPKALASVFYLPAKASEDAPYEYQIFTGEAFDWRLLDLKEESVSCDVDTKVTLNDLKYNENSNEFPQAKLNFLLENEPKFRSTWNKKRLDLNENNQSSLDMSIANFAAQYDFTDEEIVSLLVENRGDYKRDNNGRPRLDYYQTTIKEARRWAAKLETSNEYQRAELIEDAKPDQSVLDSILAKSQNEEKSTKQIRDVGIKKEYADAICETDNFAVDAGGLLYVYKNGVYVPDGKRHIEARFKGLVNERNQTKIWSSHNAREIAAYISADAEKLQEKPPLNIINVKNGLLYVDLQTGEHHLEPHTPNHLSTIQLPVDFDEHATCEEWIKFIETTFPDDTKELAWQIAAWLMIPYTSIQKSVLLVGEGSNGKSVYLNALKSFLGRENVSNMTLQKIENDRFAVAHLFGKLANICPDLPSLKLENSSIFKSIVGGDPINGEHKFEKAFKFIPFARLVFATNHLPQSNDSSFAFFRRFLVVPFTRTIAENEQIPSEILDARLADPRQLSGVLNQALKALPNLIKNGLIESASMREAKQEFRELTDPLAIWLERNCSLGSNGFVEKSKLLSEYNKDNQKHKRPTMTQHAFTKAIKRLYPTLDEKQKQLGINRREWCWFGIRLLNQ